MQLNGLHYSLRNPSTIIFLDHENLFILKWQRNRFSWSTLNGTLLCWGYEGCNEIDLIAYGVDPITPSSRFP